MGLERFASSNIARCWIKRRVKIRTDSSEKFWRAFLGQPLVSSPRADGVQLCERVHSERRAVKKVQLKCSISKPRVIASFKIFSQGFSSESDTIEILNMVLKDAHQQCQTILCMF